MTGLNIIVILKESKIYLLLLLIEFQISAKTIVVSLMKNQSKRIFLLFMSCWMKCWWDFKLKN